MAHNSRRRFITFARICFTSVELGRNITKRLLIISFCFLFTGANGGAQTIAPLPATTTVNGTTLFHTDFIQKLLLIDSFMCVAVVALSLAILLLCFITLLLYIVQLRLSTPYKVYFDDDDDDCGYSLHGRTKQTAGYA